MVGWDPFHLFPIKGYTVASRVTSFSPMPAEEIQLCEYSWLSSAVVTVPPWFWFFLVPSYQRQNALKLLFCFYNLPVFSSRVTTLHVKFFSRDFLSLVCGVGFVQKIPLCYINSQQWCSCPSAKLIMQSVLKHLNFNALNSFADQVSWFAWLALICFVIWVQLLCW